MTSTKLIRQANLLICADISIQQQEGAGTG